MWTCPPGPSDFFLQSCFPESWLQPVWVVRGHSIPDAGICICFCCLTPPVPASPFPQAVQAPPMGCPAIQHVDNSSQCCAICKPGKSALYAIIQITNEDIRQRWSQHWSLRDTAVVADCRVYFASIVIIDDFSLDMPETSRSEGDLCVLFTFVVRSPVARQTQSSKSTGY